MEDMNQREIVQCWNRHPRSVALARAELQQTIATWDLKALEDAALVVLSELITNAVVHARVPRGREIETRYRREEDGIRIEVHDAAAELPVLRTPDTGSDCGRGLALVAALADQWAVSERNGVGKVVWAVLTPPTDCGSGTE
jgi:serine/threonine-protein kinase RsbW